MKKILLMDDDMVIRMAMGKLIEGLGYEINTFENGEDAVQSYSNAQSTGEPYDIVILDYTVKNGIDGKETMKLIRELNPEALGVLATGRMHDEELDSFKDWGFNKMILKPFTIQDLNGILKELLLI